MQDCERYLNEEGGFNPKAYEMMEEAQKDFDKIYRKYVRDGKDIPEVTYILTKALHVSEYNKVVNLIL